MINEICFSDIILESATEIFETMAFMSVEKASEPKQNIDGDSLLASITFKGALEGCLSICSGMPCTKAIAINMLGTESEEEIQPKDIADALGEMANMIMGGVKSRVLESIGAIDISIPTVVHGNDLTNNFGRKNKILVEVMIDDNYPARFSMWYREASDKLRTNPPE